jgi:integrase
VKKEKDADPFTDEEIEKIKDLITPDFKMIFLLALATGLRRGELL